MPNSGNCQASMTSQAPRKPNPLFAALSFACLILPVPVARLALYLFAPTEDYLGYGGLGVALTGMNITLAAGTLLAIVSLLHKERPRLFSALCLLSHLAVIIWVMNNLPGR